MDADLNATQIQQLRELLSLTPNPLSARHDLPNGTMELAARTSLLTVLQHGGRNESGKRPILLPLCEDGSIRYATNTLDEQLLPIMTIPLSLLPARFLPASTSDTNFCSRDLSRMPSACTSKRYINKHRSAVIASVTATSSW